MLAVQPRLWAALALASTLLPSAPSLARNCADDIQKIDEAIKNQYGGSGAWWEWFACPVCLGSELKKDAIVTKEQIRDISSARNIAVLLERDQKEQMCLNLLDKPKRLLKIR